MICSRSAWIVGHSSGPVRGGPDAPFKSNTARPPKVGDRVICRHAQRTNLTEGAIYTIHDFRRCYDAHEPPYLYVLCNDEGVRHGYAPERFYLTREAV